MKLKKDSLSLEDDAKKVGCVFLLGHILYQPLIMFYEKFLNFSFIVPSNMAWYTILILASLFLLKIDLKEMFIRKSKVDNIGFKTLLLLTVFFIIFIRFFMFTCIYGTGYYKLVEKSSTMLYDGFNSSNIILITITIFISAVFEEIIYRGIILENLRKYGNMFAIVVAGILFGMVHGELIVTKSIVGITLGILYVISGNIKWTIGAHFIVNMTSGIKDWVALQFPQIKDIYINLGIIGISFVIMLIFLVFCLKNKVLKPLFEKWSIKNILNHFRKDKSSYKKFFNSPAIIINIIIGIIIAMEVFATRLKI